MVVGLGLGLDAALCPAVATAHVRQEGHLVVARVVGNEEARAAAFVSREPLGLNASRNAGVVDQEQGLKGVAVGQSVLELAIASIGDLVVA